jgi:hypothetical protein
MCNKVILVDPAWNPAHEEQAYDRAYRIGQTKPVSFYRLLVEDTVECERVVPVSGLDISWRKSLTSWYTHCIGAGGEESFGTCHS